MRSTEVVFENRITPMDAPLFRPSKFYTSPVLISNELGIDTVSLRELLAVTATREVLFSEAPQLKLASEAAGFQPHLGNFTLAGATRDGMLTAEQLGRIQAKFDHLAASAWPPR